MKGDDLTRVSGRGGSARPRHGTGWWRRVLAAAVVGAALSGVALATLSTTPSRAGETPWAGFSAEHDGLGIQPGKIKHVWLIILENKSYDASFTGLNNNTYLWQTLPSQGVLLKNYYGTGHFSLDNYVSLVSGQATQPDTQADCPDYTSFLGSLDTTGNLFNNSNFGQFASAAGPNAEAGTNGCVYPASVPTLFNQLDAAHVSWKGYAQDLGNLDSGATTSHAVGGPTQPWLDCGAPYATPSSSPTVSGGTPNTAQPNPGSANATDQYVPKHFPFPWFESILQPRATATRRTSPTCSTRATASTTTCRASRRRRRSAGSRRTTAATRMTPSARATTSRAAGATRTRPTRRR